MQVTRRHFTFLSLLLVSGALLSCSPAISIRKAIERSEVTLHDHVGFYVEELATGKPLIDVHSAHYFTPASNTKIFTLYASLKLIGDSVSALKYVVRGDSLIFQGLGDPSFLYPRTFNNGLTYSFLKSFPGRLFFSAKNFQTDALGYGWSWDDYNEYYSAERSAFPVYGNTMLITRSAQGLFLTKPARFSSDIEMAPAQGQRDQLVRDIDSNQLTYTPGAQPRSNWEIPFRTSSDLTADLLSDTLHRSVEELNFFPAGATKKVKSIPVDSVYRPLMADSDNFIAEQLMLQCAALVSDTLKTEIGIRYAQQKLLADLPDKIQWVDGSGLSRFNLVTPRSIVAVWKKIYQTVPQERLFSWLAVGGKRGTLRRAYKADKPYVFGKTGSLSNNSALSGFLITKKNKLIVFSILHNQYTTSSSQVRQETQRVLEMIRDRY